MPSLQASADALNRSEVMTRLRRFAIVALAAATVAVGSLATVPTASAMPLSCTVKLALADSYISLGNVYFSLGAREQAVYWYKLGEALQNSCRYV
jgi:hypothetical protein